MIAIEPTIDTEDCGTYRMITNNKEYDTTFNKLREPQTCLMKEKNKNPSMISSHRIFGKYIEVIGSQLTSIPTNDLVEQLESQVKNQMTLTQPKKQNRPNTPKSVWDITIPLNISMPTASSPMSATPKTYKSVAQNANQSQTAAHTVQQQPQQPQQQQQRQQQQQQQQQQQSLWRRGYLVLVKR